MPYAANCKNEPDALGVSVHPWDGYRRRGPSLDAYMPPDLKATYVFDCARICARILEKIWKACKICSCKFLEYQDLVFDFLASHGRSPGFESRAAHFASN